MDFLQTLPSETFQTNITFDPLVNEWNTFTQSSSFSEWWATTTPGARTGVIILLALIVLIPVFIWKYVQYRRQKALIAEDLYGYTIIDKKRLYYASPEAMTRQEVPGESCCGMASIPLSSPRAVNLHPIIFPTRSSSFGFTVRMWLYLRQSNYQRYGMTQTEMKSYLETIPTPRMGILTYGPFGFTDAVVQDPFQMLSMPVDWTMRVPFGIFLDRSKNKLWFILDRTRSGEAPLQAFVEDVPLDTLFQLSVVVTPQRLEIYLDGELLNVWSQQNGYTIPDESNWLLYDNVRREKTHTTNGRTFQVLEQVGFQGRIAFLEMKSNALTPMQIRQRYSEEKKYI